MCARNPQVLGEGPAALMHRIVDQMVDDYRPEVEELEDRLDELEQEVFEQPSPDLIAGDPRREARCHRRCAGSSLPQRDVIGRLARREFAVISDEMAFRFRDVYDHLVRIADEALIFQDRVTSILDAHLSNVSQPAQRGDEGADRHHIIFMPLTLLAGSIGMNVPPAWRRRPDEPAPFWWLSGMIAAVIVVMLVMFRRKRWI